MTKDNGVYKNLQQHLQGKLLEEIPDDTNLREVSRLSTSPTTTVDELQKQLRLQTYWLLDFYSTSKAKFNAEIKKELSIGIVHLYLSTDYTTTLPYHRSDGSLFDWPLFRVQVLSDQQLIDNTLKIILRKHKPPSD